MAPDTDTRIRPTKTITTLLVAVLTLLVGISGCLDLGDGGQAQASTTEAISPDLSTATQRLWDAGYADPYLDVEPTGVVHEYDLWVDESAVMEPYGDKELWALAFSTDADEPGKVPGPEIRVQQGDTVRVTLHSPNSDFPTHTIHWHGIDLPWRSDGVPFVTQEIKGPGENQTYTYEFVAKQAGTYWYHCVVSFPVDVDMGLFGALIVEPQDPDADLPYDREEVLIFHEADSQFLQAASWALNDGSDPSKDDLPSNPVDLAGSVVNQGRAAADLASGTAGGASGEYLFNEGPRPYYPMFSPRYKPLYDTFMINGKSYPGTEPIGIQAGQTLRLRMINAGQMHKSIHLHGHHMLVTHNDGYPLPTPHWEDTLSLAPGERKDVYVQGTNPGIWKLHDHSGASGMGTTNANDHAFPGGQITSVVYEQFEPPESLPKPTGEDVTAGDLAVYAPSYRYR